MSTESSLVSLIAAHPILLQKIQKAGITDEHFPEGPWRNAYRWVLRMKREHGAVPSAEMIENRYKVELHATASRSLPILISQMQEQKKFYDFTEAIDEAARHAGGAAGLDDAMGKLQQEMNRLSLVNGANKGVVDAFSPEVQQRMQKDYMARRRGEAKGIPTGLRRFDSIIGGLHKQHMIVVMARSGIGKSALNLLFITEAVLSGHKCVLFPLEMTLEETAYRLYTIFSNRLWGEDQALKNLDLTMGRVTPRKVVKLMGILEDRFAGQLHIADIASMADPYTVERVEAEIAAHQPDLGWVDYIQLMKGPAGRDKVEDHTTVKVLSNGIKSIAQRHNCAMGVSAQVNREALKKAVFLPRIENISGGDAIGCDADLVLSLNRRDQEHLFYAVVKNRHGAEMGRTRVKFGVNTGAIRETEEQPSDEDDT